jgi:hypothetical protein
VMSRWSSWHFTCAGGLTVSHSGGTCDTSTVFLMACSIADFQHEHCAGSYAQHAWITRGNMSRVSMSGRSSIRHAIAARNVLHVKRLEWLHFSAFPTLLHLEVTLRNKKSRASASYTK